MTVDKALPERRRFRSRIAFTLVLLFTVFAMLGVSGITGAFAQANDSAVTMTAERAEVMKFGLIAAAIAFGFGAIGAGLAIANVGAAAMGAIGEKPEIASQALIFIALAEGLVVFGFITALMILGKI